MKTKFKLLGMAKNDKAEEIFMVKLASALQPGCRKVVLGVLLETII